MAARAHRQTGAVVEAEQVEPVTGTESAVRARDVTRRYGDCETAVDALRGVSLDV